MLLCCPKSHKAATTSTNSASHSILCSTALSLLCSVCVLYSLKRSVSLLIRPLRMLCPGTPTFCNTVVAQSLQCQPQMHRLTKLWKQAMLLKEWGWNKCPTPARSLVLSAHTVEANTIELRQMEWLMHHMTLLDSFLSPTYQLLHGHQPACLQSNSWTCAYSCPDNLHIPSRKQTAQSQLFCMLQQWAWLGA